MTQLPSSHPSRRAGVVPLFGGGDQVPSPVLVRGAVGRAGEGGVERVRAAEAVASALGELVREASAGERRPRWDRPVAADEGELMRRTGLLHAEVREGLARLVEARAAAREGAGVRLEESVTGELPCLARVAWDRVRGALDEVGARPAPALAVLREVARRARPDAAQGGSDWVASSLPALGESVGYGRTAVSQALSALGAAGFLERTAERRLRVRLLPAALGEPGGAAAAPPAASASLPAPSSPAAAEAPGGASPALRFGSHPVHLPPGTPLELERRADGGSRLRMGPLVVETDPDGSQTLVYGALRLRP